MKKKATDEKKQEQILRTTKSNKELLVENEMSTKNEQIEEFAAIIVSLLLVNEKFMTDK